MPVDVDGIEVVDGIDAELEPITDVRIVSPVRRLYSSEPSMYDSATVSERQPPRRLTISMVPPAFATNDADVRRNV